jgi:hypothetical protein
MKNLIRPSPEEAIELLEESRSGIKRHMIIIIGNCKVEYSGRAKSFLGYGDRLVMIKADGTLMVHNNEKREPLNWQPPGSKISYLLEEGLVIMAKNLKPVESMHIHFHEIISISVFQLDDGAKMDLIGEEEDIVDRIVEDPSVIEPGLRIIRREKVTASGFIDLFCEDKNGTSVIVEVKRTMISPSSVYQLEAYIMDLKKKNNEVRIRGILCAPRISSIAKTLIEEKGLEYRKVEWEFELSDKKQRSLETFFSK